jgi:hypothetical protein
MRCVAAVLPPLLLVSLSLFAASPAQAAPPTVDVRVDPRVELMSVLFRLAGNPEYNRARVPGYTEKAEARFRPFAEHAAVAYARRLRETRGVSFDAVMGLAVHLRDVKSLEPVVPLDPRPAGLDPRWQPDEMKAFLAHVRSFVQDTGFLTWFAANEAYYTEVVTRMEAALQAHARLEWIEGFFGVPAKASFSLSLGLLNGGQCYGPRVVHADGHEDIHCVLGVWLLDETGTPRFDKSVMPTVVHEFCHSYCNPLVDAHAEALEPIGERLWPAVAERMRRQAYAGWKTMLYESLVRASVIRYLAAVEGEAGMRAQADADKQLGFLWIEELAASLAGYEKQREAYPTLEAYLPRIQKTLVAFAGELDRMKNERPKVLTMTPAPGAKDVDPGLEHIVVVFDRPMRDGGWAFVGGGPTFPEVAGQPSYDAARTTLTLPIRLKPEWRYEFWLNRGKFNGFQSEQGVPLESVHVTFQTAKAP